jgi:predicted porin
MATHSKNLGEVRKRFSNNLLCPPIHGVTKEIKMQKTVLTKAVAVALAALGASAAIAQSSVTLYGNLDVAVDNVHKGQGNISGTAFQTLPAVIRAGIIAAGGSTTTADATQAALVKGYNAGFQDRSSVTRLTSSISSVNALGVKGVEDIGGGYKGNFVLEGQFQVDTGAQSGQDSRMWGRQAYVGLTTPVGEVRLGRQYAPMFFAFAYDTVEALGGADIMGSGLIVNNLQVRQDNQISYWLKAGDLTAALSYSPNAGVDSKVSSARLPSSTSSTGQIIGGNSAGAENSTGRGRSYGVFLNYAVAPELLVNGSYHSNKFGDAKLTDGTGSITLFNLDKFVSYSLGAKYTVPGVGTQLAAIYHRGQFTNDAGDPDGAKINTYALGVKHPIDNFAVGAEYAYSKFANFTKGKDSSLMLIGDYNFSKRTKVYMRAGYAKDSRGELAPTAAHAYGVDVAGGPLPLLTGFGSLETPFFSAAGANVDATTRVVAIGIRHQF